MLPQTLTLVNNLRKLGSISKTTSLEQSNHVRPSQKPPWCSDQYGGDCVTHNVIAEYQGACGLASRRQSECKPLFRASYALGITTPSLFFEQRTRPGTKNSYRQMWCVVCWEPARVDRVRSDWIVYRSLTMINTRFGQRTTPPCRQHNICHRINAMLW
jgi:hypothetical protein